MKMSQLFKELATEVANGDINALEGYIILKQSEKQLEEALAIVQPLAIAEADKYAEKTIHAYGAIIEKRSAPSRWDYSSVAAWNQAKERLDYIQKIAQAGGGADTDSGEIIDKAFKVPGKAIIAVSIKHEDNL